MKNLLISIKITLAFCAILFCGYVLVLWGVASCTQQNEGQAELITHKGKVVGALSVGQAFTDSIYFFSRPSAVNYDGGASGGSNKATTNKDYLQEVETRVVAFLEAHPYLERGDVPSEMVTSSGSGLDPHISPASARVQAQRVAQARGVSVEEVSRVVEAAVEKPAAGTEFVNVLKLNVALDETFSR